MNKNYSDSIQRQTWRRMSLNAFFMLAGSLLSILNSGSGFFSGRITFCPPGAPSFFGKFSIGSLSSSKMPSSFARQISCP